MTRRKKVSICKFKTSLTKHYLIENKDGRKEGGKEEKNGGNSYITRNSSDFFQ